MSASTYAALAEASGSVVHTLREKAEELQAWGAREAATSLLRAAAMTEERLTAALDEPLSLELAARESGYSADRLGRLVREGTIPNAGQLNAPRIRRRDLPRRPGHGCYPTPVASEERALSSARSQMARSVVASH